MKDFNDLSEDEQVEIITNFYSKFKFYVLYVPSKDCKYLLNAFFYYLNINNLSENVKFRIVEKNVFIIEFIDNPSYKVQSAFINSNPYNIRFLKKPTEKIQLLAVRKYGEVIKCIDNPSEKVQLEAVRSLEYFDYIFIEIFTSPKAKELYYKLKKVHGVIK
jgi:hypothetical protein